MAITFQIKLVYTAWLILNAKVISSKLWIHIEEETEENGY